MSNQPARSGLVSFAADVDIVVLLLVDAVKDHIALLLLAHAVSRLRSGELPMWQSGLLLHFLHLNCPA